METLDELVGMYWRTTVIREIVGDKTFYIASNPTLPGCFGQGHTVKDAIEDLKEARRLYLRCMIEDGLEIPKPTWSPMSNSIDVEAAFTVFQNVPDELRLSLKSIAA